MHVSIEFLILKSMMFQLNDIYQALYERTAVIDTTSEVENLGSLSLNIVFQWNRENKKWNKNS